MNPTTSYFAEMKNTTGWKMLMEEVTKELDRLTQAILQHRGTLEEMRELQGKRAGLELVMKLPDRIMQSELVRSHPGEPVE